MQCTYLMKFIATNTKVKIGVTRFYKAFNYFRTFMNDTLDFLDGLMKYSFRLIRAFENVKLVVSLPAMHQARYKMQPLNHLILYLPLVVH